MTGVQTCALPISIPSPPVTVKAPEVGDVASVEFVIETALLVVAPLSVTLCSVSVLVVNAINVLGDLLQLCVTVLYTKVIVPVVNC